jgi:hypothetical protein
MSLGRRNLCIDKRSSALSNGVFLHGHTVCRLGYAWQHDGRSEVESPGRVASTTESGAA